MQTPLYVLIVGASAFVLHSMLRACMSSSEMVYTAAFTSKPWDVLRRLLEHCPCKRCDWYG